MLLRNRPLMFLDDSTRSLFEELFDRFSVWAYSRPEEAIILAIIVPIGLHLLWSFVSGIKSKIRRRLEAERNHRAQVVYMHETTYPGRKQYDGTFASYRPKKRANRR
ncbi:MAG: hypothetical protein K1X79_05935 [Oligoflexia bacterium]|nr:hypothetical protein [Oligoflexia bacterium]